MSTYGTFYSGDSYICLSVSLHTSNGPVHTGDHYSFVFTEFATFVAFYFLFLCLVYILKFWFSAVIQYLFLCLVFDFVFSSSLIYQTRKVESHLEWDIHFWLGSTTSQVNALLWGFQCRVESNSSKKCTILLFLYTDQHVGCVIIIVSY